MRVEVEAITGEVHSRPVRFVVKQPHAGYEPGDAGVKPDGEQAIQRHSGFRFPGSIGDLQGGEVLQYDRAGHEVSVGYNRTKLLAMAVTKYDPDRRASSVVSCLFTHFRVCDWKG